MLKYIALSLLLIACHKPPLQSSEHEQPYVISVSKLYSSDTECSVAVSLTMVGLGIVADIGAVYTNSIREDTLWLPTDGMYYGKATMIWDTGNTVEREFTADVPGGYAFVCTD